MRKIAGVVLGLVLALAWAPVAARAQDGSGGNSDDFSLTVGGRGWVTWGFSQWNFDAPGISPISELKWRGVDTVIPELNLDMVWGRLILMANVGAREIDEGVLTDNDYAASGRRDRWSYTRSEVKADDEPGVAFGSLDLGGRVLRWKLSNDGPQGYLDYFAGYQYWRERYDAFGARGFADPCVLAGIGACPVSTSVPSATDFITEEFVWHSLRAGLRTQVPVGGPVSFRAKAVALPYNWFEFEDLRPDLRQDPSFSASAQGGFGMQLEGGISLHLTSGLSMEAGYRYFAIESDEGDVDIRGVAGTVTTNLRGAETERHGPYLGLEYRF